MALLILAGGKALGCLQVAEITLAICKLGSKGDKDQTGVYVSVRKFSPLLFSGMSLLWSKIRLKDSEGVV